MKEFTEEEIKGLLASYVLGDSSPEETAMVHQLLQSHPELQQEVDSLQKTLALYPLALPEVELPRTLGDRILAQAKSENQATQTIVKHRRLSFMPIFGVVSAALIVVLGGYSYSLQRQIAKMDSELEEYRSAIALLRQADNNFVSLKGTELNPQSSGSLLVNTQADTIMVAIQNLPPIAEDQVYRLWGILGDEMIYCGEFKPDQNGNSLIKFPLDPDVMNSSAVMITLEQSQSDLHPTGKTVMVSQI